MLQDDILARLVAMSNNLGEPALGYVILGGGNTSARADADTFWVKASGTRLSTVDRAGFVRVRFDRALALLDESDLSGDATKESLSEKLEGRRWPTSNRYPTPNLPPQCVRRDCTASAI